MEKPDKEEKEKQRLFTVRSGMNTSIQAMIMSACQSGEKIIMPRNLDESAINGAILSGAIPIYISPEWDDELATYLPITLNQIRSIVESEGGIRALFLVNPTNQGRLYELKSIVEYCNKENIAVLIDATHDKPLLCSEDQSMVETKYFADLIAVSTIMDKRSKENTMGLILRAGILENTSLKQVLRLLEGCQFNEIESNNHIKLPPFGKCILSPRDAFNSKKEMVLLEESIGRIAGESITIVENKVTLIIGELISKEMIQYIKEIKSIKAVSFNAHDEHLEKIKVVTTKKYIKNIR